MAFFGSAMLSESQLKLMLDMNLRISRYCHAPSMPTIAAAYGSHCILMIAVPTSNKAPGTYMKLTYCLDQTPLSVPGHFLLISFLVSR